MACITGHGGPILKGNHAGVSSGQEDGTRLPGDHEKDNFVVWCSRRASFRQRAGADAGNRAAGVPIPGHFADSDGRSQSQRQATPSVKG
jgi:hypothetical protein